MIIRRRRSQQPIIAVNSRHDSISLHFCLACWRQIWDGSGFDQVGGTRDKNVELVFFPILEQLLPQLPPAYPTVANELSATRDIAEAEASMLSSKYRDSCSNLYTHHSQDDNQDLEKKHFLETV
ncbi:hypothetical protein E2C01_035352 [Portunus trituberculatus]|uniref:Uncharacterized protein n=1 Tax=Portunus trituberculatus TaxID=210409 RepID=A0A5B7F9J0_PORTR|nr:hypothetical protein [Portunus trituberculatus]